MQADKAKDAKGGKTEAQEPAKEDPKAKLPGNPPRGRPVQCIATVVDASGEIEVICSHYPFPIYVYLCY